MRFFCVCTYGYKQIAKAHTEIVHRRDFIRNTPDQKSHEEKCVYAHSERADGPTISVAWIFNVLNIILARELFYR